MKKSLACMILISTMVYIQSIGAEEQAAPQPQVMNIELMESVIAKIDADYQREGNVIAFTYSELEITLLTDPDADRMRIVIPVVETGGMNAAILERLMQANFDSALDARYAIAQGVVWSTFLHRMSTLTVEDFLSGIGQAINIVDTFGTSFTSGELTFGGGDSNDIHRKLIDELLRRGTI